MHVPFLLNWYLNPYHTPLAVAKVLGFFREYDIDLALLEPTDPSDVTKIVGNGQIPLGLKAMVHCFAARARGFPIQSIGTLLDEPPTGIIAPLQKNIRQLADIVGKRIGYVGEFGKIMIDQLLQAAGLPNDSYEAVRVGMDAAHAILTDQVDAAIGIASFQQIELTKAGIDCHLLRIDELAHLGCCCFCSIQLISHGSFLSEQPSLLQNFLQALSQGMKITRENPDYAWECLLKIKPRLNTETYQQIFYQCLPFFSKDLRNNERDWDKVGHYAQKLNITSAPMVATHCYTNQFFTG